MERKGICKNIGVCSKANKIQIITDDDAEFVCSECGEELQPYVEEKKPQKKSNAKLPIIIIVSIAVIAIIVGCIVAFSGNKTEDEVPATDSIANDTTEAVKQDTVTVVKTDTIRQVDTVKVEKVVEKQVTPIAKTTKTTTTTTTKSTGSQSASNSTINLGYGKYTGAVKNGQPNGMGTMRFTSSHVIDSRDSKGRTAEAGDYVTGEWKDGHLVQGRWYDSSNNVKGSLMIGM